MKNKRRRVRDTACLAYLEELRREEDMRRRGWAYVLVERLFKWNIFSDRRRWYRRERQLIERAVTAYRKMDPGHAGHATGCSLGELLLLDDGWRVRVLPFDPTGGGEMFEAAGGVGEVGARRYVFESN